MSINEERFRFARKYDRSSVQLFYTYCAEINSFIAHSHKNVAVFDPCTAIFFLRRRNLMIRNANIIIKI